MRGNYIFSVKFCKAFLPGRAVVVAANVQRPLAEFGRVQNFAQTGLISLKRNVTTCLSEKRMGLLPIAHARIMIC